MFLIAYGGTFSDDMLIKLWNWEKSWSCQQVFEGHTHYVMQIVINPKDNNTFASASLDRNLKVNIMKLIQTRIHGGGDIKYHTSNREVIVFKWRMWKMTVRVGSILL